MTGTRRCNTRSEPTEMLILLPQRDAANYYVQYDVLKCMYKRRVKIRDTSFVAPRAVTAIIPKDTWGSTPRQEKIKRCCLLSTVRPPDYFARYAKCPRQMWQSMSKPSFFHKIQQRESQTIHHNANKTKKKHTQTHKSEVPNFVRETYDTISNDMMI